MKFIRPGQWLACLLLSICMALGACKSGVTLSTRTEPPRWQPDYEALGTLSFEALEDSLYLYETHADINIRRQAFHVYYLLAMQHPGEQGRRSRTIAKLLSSCGDSLQNAYACQPCGEYLLDFDADEFDRPARDKILWIVSRGDYATAYAPQPADYLPYEDYILLAGKLYLQETKPYLEKLISPASSYVHKWEARLALARMGNPEAVDYCVAEIKAGLKPGERPQTGALDQLAYIRHEAVIEAFNIFLYSNDPMPDPIIVDGSGPGLSSAAFIIPYYAALLEDFPLAVHNRYYEALYTESEIALARQWVRDNKGRYRFKL